MSLDLVLFHSMLFFDPSQKRKTCVFPILLPLSRMKDGFARAYGDEDAVPEQGRMALEDSGQTI